MQFIKRRLKAKYLSLLGIHFAPRTFQEALVRLEAATPFLLVGLPRSGTSITQSWINQHPQAYVSYESIIEPFIQEKNRYRLAAFYYESLRQHEHLVSSLGGNNTKPSVQSSHYSLIGNKSIFQQGKKYQQGLVSAINKQTNLKVVFIDRDPKDRIASILKWHDKRDTTLVNTVATSTNTKKIIQTECHRSNDFTQFVSQFIDKENVLVLNYERLATKNVDVHALFSFMGLSECDEVKSFFQDTMQAGSIEKWREDLSEEQLRLIETLCIKK
ncbi:MAG: hypothetical protein ACJAT7_003312 [Psychromonas sp.]|jgi:hypothetical protein|uniref:sulfotransferase domain-containing protein n=1 Tax=Psychromonas sp. TaxID=1884585 RepID=UPI0039E39EA3